MPPATPLGARLAVTFAGQSFDLPKATGGGRESLTALQWTTQDARGTYRASGRGALVEAGRAGGPWAFTHVDFTQPAFAAWTLTALDGKGRASSDKLLLTLAGRCENTGMEFSADRRTVGRNWGGPPVRVEAPAGVASIDLTEPKGFRCYALDPAGRPAAEVPLEVWEQRARAGVKFTFGPQHQTMWYLLTRTRYDLPAAAGGPAEPAR